MIYDHKYNFLIYALIHNIHQVLFYLIKKKKNLRLSKDTYVDGHLAKAWPGIFHLCTIRFAKKIQTSTDCVGTHCYKLVFFGMADVCLVGFGLDVVLILHCRILYLYTQKYKQAREPQNLAMTS